MAAINHKKIAVNTLILYFRMLLLIGVSLYVVRVVLNTLGASDYGVYSVVAGMVALCAFLSSAMASATQRFFSFALGQNDKEKLYKTFTVNVALYSIIAVVAWAILASVGSWYVENYLKIPQGRFEAATHLYQVSIFTLVIGIFTSPFMAIMIAHEDMKIYAYAAICDSLMKLLSAILLSHLAWDKLELYGLLLLAIAIINAIVYVGICVKRYEECQFRKFYWDSELLREIVGFTGWTLFGQMSTTARNHAVTVLLNQAFNPLTVAARAIAINVATQINIFSTNFNTSLYPPIIKSYATGQKEEMFSLIFMGSRITFFLMWMLALPLLLEADILLSVWLENPPPNTVLFSRLALMEAVIMSVSLPLATAARAPGKMARYEFSLGLIQFAVFFVCWFILKLGSPAWSVFVVAIIANLLMFAVRLQIVHGLIDIPVKGYLREVMIPVLKVTAISSVPSLIVSSVLKGGIIFSGVSVFLSIISVAVSSYFFGLDQEIRTKLRQAILTQFIKMKSAI